MKTNDGQKTTILVIDDDSLVLDLLNTAFRRQGYRMLCAGDGESALKLFQTEKVDLAIVDYSLPDTCGSDLFNHLHDANPNLPVMILTGHPNLDTAVDLMKKGVRDYLAKPFSLQEIATRIRTALSPAIPLAPKAAAATRTALPDGQTNQGAQTPNKYLFGNSAAIQQVETQVRNLPRYPYTTVLITGPTGTGKSAIARRIHELTWGDSERFFEIDCSTIPHDLCESELFGHERGAFTGAHCAKRGLFEAARNGTAFLDEIGELDPRLQVKFLRVLEARQFKRVGGHSTIPMSARVIAATNQSLPDLIRAGRFREDLYFRLNVIELNMPPLRERQDDVLMLARHFLEHFARSHAKNIVGFTTQALDWLCNCPLPGNVRELRNLIERAVILADSAAIDVVHLDRERRTGTLNRPQELLPSSPQPVTPLAVEGIPQITLAELEKNLLVEALTSNHGNKSQAARAVGLSRTAFHRRLQKHSRDWESARRQRGAQDESASSESNGRTLELHV